VTQMDSPVASHTVSTFCGTRMNSKCDANGLSMYDSNGEKNAQWMMKGCISYLTGSCVLRMNSCDMLMCVM